MTGTAATRVLVIGGGIAGSAAALGLRRAGFDVRVYEAHSGADQDIGAFLTLASTGMRALAQLDATRAVTAIGFPLTSLRLLDAEGAELAHVPLGEVAEPDLRYRCLRRGELNSALQREVSARGVRLTHGARLTSVTDGPYGVTARFADGTTATGDLLIGADGLNSAVRRALSPGVRPRYAGQRVFYGRTPGAPGTGGSGVITMVRGSESAFGYAEAPTGETYWFARVGGDPLPERGPGARSAVPREELLPLLRADTTPAAALVAGCPGPVMVTNATEMPLGARWHTGRVLLIGDAAHAASPATGQGASTALEDAVVLAKALRDLPDAARAFGAYERHRRPRVEHNITVSGGISRGTHAPARPADPNHRPDHRDEVLIRQLAWDTPLSEQG
ncbi:FAD-dependent monooxygenase [Streptomyces murinus]|uniref:FAD-dependent oxidoreductase n=1 Tax=Streptomyces murinus TaxID=33900 RepID=UPI002E818F40|nr:FAD-dependent monooxygenase [Streptomyces murinus]WUD11252.1 FAD-dependent monooxygenase [Streptomyces murinus]